MSGLDGYDIEPRDDEDAPDGTERRLGAFPDPELSLCPVTPLGFLGPRVVFAMPEGEIRQELASKIAGMLRTDIFACQAGSSFLTTWRDSDDKFQRDLATVWFVRKCREAGLWDLNRPVRSLGVWPSEGGGVVLHRGCEVIAYRPDGKVERATIAEALRRPRGPLYKLRPPAPAPGEPASAADGLWLRDRLDHWRFETIGDDGLTGADLVLGWVGGGMQGGAAPFRAHCMVDAMPGSGKTTLIELLHAAMSAITGDVIDSFSEAGLRNDLAGMARPVLIDEAESAPSSHGPGPVERALELLRRMSTGAGGTRKMGDIGGGSVTQTAVGAVLLAGVNTPRLSPADATRFVQVRLMPLKAPPPDGSPPPPLATATEIAAMVERAKGLAPAFLGRALHLAARYRADVAEVKAALDRLGEAPRTADLIAMLAAGRRLMTSDEPLDEAAADDEVKFWRPLLEARAQTEAVSNTGADAFAHLMNAPSGKHVQDRVATLGELVKRRALDRERDLDEVLKANGVKVYEDEAGPWLLVANHHPTLERVFASTSWQDWRRALAYLDALGPEYATRPTGKQRFGLAVEQRALAVPLAPWLGQRSASRSGVPAGVPVQDDEFA